MEIFENPASGNPCCFVHLSFLNGRVFYCYNAGQLRAGRVLRAKHGGIAGPFPISVHEEIAACP